MGFARSFRRKMRGATKQPKERAARAGLLAGLQKRGLTLQDAILLTGTGITHKKGEEPKTREEAMAKLATIEAFHADRKKRESSTEPGPGPEIPKDPSKTE